MAKGRGADQREPVSLGVILFEATAEVNERPEKYGTLFISQTCFDDQPTEFDFLARVMFAGVV
jgi:hypothetical protein